VFLVAILTGAPGDDAAVHARFAAALGTTAYEARLALAGGFPAVVLTTPDGARAESIASSLRAHGDDAVACDAARVVSSEAMTALDRFTLGPGAVTAGREAHLLPYADILCLLRAVHRRRAATETRTTETRFSAGRALLTGGLSNTKTVTKTTVESTDAREPVLYVFRRSGLPPWILRETGTHYEGLEEARGRTTIENFATTVRLLRERAPRALYDERLLLAHRARERHTLQGTSARATVTASSASGIDVLAHLIALAVQRG
jgi:hypothetical protein